LQLRLHRIRTLIERRGLAQAAQVHQAQANFVQNPAFALRGALLRFLRYVAVGEEFKKQC
jgi:hypothetical protein